MNKILSVIIPLYNSAQWVEKCLDSVLNQDVPMEQMEIICVNDGSPDNSVEIVRGKSEEVKGKNGYSPIVVLDQENQGPSGARNNGMRHATGKYLMFVDPDDYVEPNTFGVLVAQSRNNWICYGSISVWLMNRIVRLRQSRKTMILTILPA